jgi:beta-lactamase class A
MKMERELQAIVNEFNGDVGIYVEHLPSGRHIAIHADSVFPTASMVKVPIMTRIFERMELGELHYDSLHVYQDSLYYAGSDVVGSLKAGESISLHKLIFLMISFSDNTASLWLQHLAGTGTQINEQMERLGLQDTRVNSRTPGREQARGMYGWGQTTPREMATLLKMIRNGEVVSAAQSEEMYRIMSKSLWDKEALSQIPMHINAASKQGAVSASRSEVVLVNAPGGDYVFCVVTKNQQDRSWDDDNAGYVLIRNVSRVLWDGFNL